MAAHALQRIGGAGEIDSPAAGVLRVPAFERAWYREYKVTTAAFRRAHFSAPAFYELGLDVDQAVLELDIDDTQVLGTPATLTLSVRFEDSADGTFWSPVGSTFSEDDPTGTRRIAAEAPFGALLRVRIDVETDEALAIGAIKLAGRLALRRIERSDARPDRGAPDVPGMGSKPQRPAPGGGGCGEGCGGGCA